MGITFWQNLSSLTPTKWFSAYCALEKLSRENFTYFIFYSSPLKGVLRWIYISFSFSGSIGESCRQKWKWIFSKIHLILWFFIKEILCSIYFLNDNFWLIWNPWRCSNIWTTTTISTKKNIRNWFWVIVIDL